MTKLYTKGSTVTDEVLSGAERYDIKEDAGTAYKANMQVVLATPVAVAGTALDAARINNMENGIDQVDTTLNNAGLNGISALTLADDDVFQRKAGVWVSRSMAQLKTDLVAQFTWAAFTPVWTQSATITKTIGYSKYLQLGKIVMFQGALQATSAGTAGGIISVTVPVTAAAAATFQMNGTAMYYDASTNTTYEMHSVFLTTNSLYFFGSITAGDAFGVTPAVTVAAGDYIAWNIFYEVP